MFNLLRFVFERIDGLAIDKYSIEILVIKQRDNAKRIMRSWRCTDYYLQVEYQLLKISRFSNHGLTQPQPNFRLHARLGCGPTICILRSLCSMQIENEQPAQLPEWIVKCQLCCFQNPEPSQKAKTFLTSLQIIYFSLFPVNEGLVKYQTTLSQCEYQDLTRCSCISTTALVIEAQFCVLQDFGWGNELIKSSVAFTLT